MDKQEVMAGLDRALVCEGRSLLAYLSDEADLQISTSSEEARAMFEGIRSTAASHRARLIDEIHSRGGSFDLGSYPFSFMRYNYVTVDHVLVPLREGLEATFRCLEEAANSIVGLAPAVESLLRGMAETRKAQLDDFGEGR